MDEDEDVKSSFRGSLSRFAYLGPSVSSVSTSTSSDSSLSSHRRPSRTRADPDTATVQPRNGIRFSNVLGADGAQAGGARADIAPSASLASKRKTGETAGKQRAGRGSKRQNRRETLGRAAPGSDSCARLGGIPDHVAQDLDVLFCGINPGYMSAVRGHHYANPTNHFWRCLHLSGFTPRLLSASEDSTLPGTYSLGLANLVDRPSASMADLSSQEMARSVPTLLAKIARLRPRVACFIGKGIWLHVERSLRLQADGSDGSGLVVRTTERCVTLKEEEIDNLMPHVSVYSDAWPAKAEPKPSPLNATSTTDSARGTEGGEISRRQLLAVQKAEEILNAVPLSSSSSSMTAKRKASPKAAARATFAYGLQPYKAIHDAATNLYFVQKLSVRETLFCVFPSTSGRVVSHQRDDKLALFKMLRDDLDHIKAGTLDTSCMRPVRLAKDT